METNSLADWLCRELAKEPCGAGRAGAGSPPIAWASTRGLVRKENQDRLLVARSRTGLVVAIVADGMGGMRDGSHAAALSTAAVAAHCMMAEPSPPPTMLTDALNFANHAVFNSLHGDGGAALVVVASTPTGRYVAHVGDARAYHLQSDGDLAQLTIDDTVEAQLERFGRSPSSISQHDGRLLQFVGLGDGLEPHVRDVPEDGRGLILATDGIYGVPDAVLQWIVKATKATGGLQSLAERLMAVSKWSGGHDNATVVAFSFGAERTQGLPDAAEFWMPGKQLVVSTLTPVVSPVQSASSDEEQPSSLGTKTKRACKKASRGRRTTKKTPGEDQGQNPCQLPIVTFHDTPPTNEIHSPATGDDVPQGTEDREESQDK